MGTYSIKELSNLSQIQPHTLRIWEQRYGLLKPKRTTTNIRFYNDEDVKFLLKVAALNRQGMRISKIAALSTEDMISTYNEIVNETCNNQIAIDQLTLSMIELDEVKFNQILGKAIEHKDFEHVVLEIMYPFLNKIGALWLSDNINPSQEHFVTNLIRQKIIVAIDQLDYVQPINGNRFLLFLPQNEIHELGLLFAHYVLKVRKQSVIYLGANVPYKDLAEVMKISEVDYLFTIFTNSLNKRISQKYLNALIDDLPRSNGFKVLMSGPSISSRLNDLKDDMLYLTSPKELLNYIKPAQ